MNPAASIPVRQNAKSALVRWQEFQHRLPTEAERFDWTRRWPHANTALLTGAVSGVVVLDVDAQRNGQEALREQPLPLTRVVRTPSGGWHYYFEHPGRAVPCVPDLLPGVDLKGDGGYVLTPPSVIDGRTYEVDVDEPAVPMPTWLVTLIDQHKISRNGQRRLPPSEIARLLVGVGEGQRNQTATKLAGHFLGKGLPAKETLEILRAWNMRNTTPLEDKELVIVVGSIASRDARNHPGRSRGAAAPPGLTPDQFHATDLGNAHRLVHQHGQDLRFCRKLATWFVWDGRRWQADETGEVFRRAKQTVASMYADAARLSDDAQRKTLGTWATRSEAADRLAAMVRLAETEQRVVVEASQLDAAPYQLTCLNGAASSWHASTTTQIGRAHV